MAKIIMFIASLVIGHFLHAAVANSDTLLASTYHNGTRRFLALAETPPSGSAGTPFDGVLDYYGDPTVGALNGAFANVKQKISDVFGSLVEESTGEGLKDTLNCQAMPLGFGTSYSVLGFPDILGFLKIPDTAPFAGLFMDNGLNFGPAVEDLANNKIFPDGSKLNDECIPVNQEAAQARAIAHNAANPGGPTWTEADARKCTTTVGSVPCCRQGSCLDPDGDGQFECIETCLSDGDECYTDAQCACIGTGYTCVIEDADGGDVKSVDPDRFTGTCKAESSTVEYKPICLVWNDNMFAIRFFPGFPPFYWQLPTKLPKKGEYFKKLGAGKPCNLIDGVPLATFPTKNLQITFQFSGIGVAWNDGVEGKPSMIFGTSSTTKASSVNAPTIYDGLYAQVPVIVPEINFWISFNLRFIPLDAHTFNKASCLAGTDNIGSAVTGILPKLSIEMLLELYINTSSEKGCVLLVVPVANFKFSIIPVINLGSAIGGYCRLPGDLCTPDGFFMNLQVRPDLGGLTGVAEDVLSFAGGAETDAGSAALSAGFFIDKETGDPVGGLVRAAFESPNLLGLSLGIGDLAAEFQYISNEELERRRWTITTDEFVDGIPVPRCPAYKDCTSWKPYKLTDSSGNEKKDAIGNIIYPNHVICASALEDRDFVTGVGPFNRQLLARVPRGDPAGWKLAQSPGEWHVQDFFSGYDMFVVSFRVPTLGFSIFKLGSLSFTLVFFGDIQPAVNSDEDFPNDAARIAACEAAERNNELFFYLNLEAGISFLFLVSFEGRLTIANVPVDNDPDDVFGDLANANKFIIDAFAELFILGLTTRVVVYGDWVYASERGSDETSICSEITRRRLESDHHQRNLEASLALSDAPIYYDVSISCDSFLDCMEDIATFVYDQLKIVWNTLKKGFEALLKGAEIVFTAIGDAIAAGAEWLGLKIVEQFEDFWEELSDAYNTAVDEFNAIAEDGFQFTDILEYGLALAKGVGSAILGGINFVTGFIGIGFGTQRDIPRIMVGISSINCPLYQNRVETCVFEIWGACAGRGVKNVGKPYPERTCVDLAAQAAARVNTKTEELKVFSDDKTKEQEEDNQGFYTTFNDTCDVSEDACPVAKPQRFEVKQTIDKDGASMQSNLNVEGLGLQRDAAGTVAKTMTVSSALDVRPQEERRILQAGECETVLSDDGTTICKATEDQIRLFYNEEAKEAATKSAMGTTLGKESDATKKYVDEAAWAPPRLSINGGLERYELEADCTDERLLDDGKPVDFLLQVAKMQELVLNSPGVTLELDQNVEGLPVENIWNQVGRMKSCIEDSVSMTYRVKDATGKESNAVQFDFSVEVVPPRLEFSGEAEYNLACEPTNINPFSEPPAFPLPSSGGGCLTDAFESLQFVDQITSDIRPNTCSSYTIARSWTVLPPRTVPDDMNNAENIAIAACNAQLAKAVPSVDYTIDTGCQPEEPSPLLVPEKCTNSPFRVKGYENLSQGLAKLDLLRLGIESLFTDEFLKLGESDLQPEIVNLDPTEKPLEGKYLTIAPGNTFSSVDGVEQRSVASLLENAFYFDKEGNVKHRSLTPQSFVGYTGLCNKVVGVFVDEKKDRGGYVCFQAVCDEIFAEAEPIRARALSDEGLSTGKNVTEIMEDLRTSPKVDLMELARQQTHAIVQAKASGLSENEIIAAVREVNDQRYRF